MSYRHSNLLYQRQGKFHSVSLKIHVRRALSNFDLDLSIERPQSSLIMLTSVIEPVLHYGEIT